MKITRMLLAALFILFLIQVQPSQGQTAAGAAATPKLEVYYFHPTERCSIDQSIEETTRKLMRTDYAAELKNGTIRFQVLNTDDKANAKTVARFEMNAQALYLVYRENGREVKKDLTEFAFSTCQNNPAKFRAGLKEEIVKVLK